MSDPVSLWATVQADHGEMQRLREKYDDRYEPGTARSGGVDIVKDLVTNVGFQQLAVFRLAQACHRRRLTPLAMLISRLIRHLYSAEMHYEAAVEPGIVLVHGNGLVISRAAAVGPRCQLSQNVTLGLSSGNGDRPGGAPRLHADVNVGPGAVLVGPIEVGPSAKVAPNAVVMSDVPSDTVVLPPEPTLRPRGGRAATSSPT